MRILVVQESDWLKRNPHQQHHLMDRMAVKGHVIKVIDYPIDWSKEDNNGLIYHKQHYYNISKVIDKADIEVIRPSFIKLPVFSYLSLYFTHKNEIEKQIKTFKPDLIVGLGLLNAYSASKLANKYNIPFVYYLIDVLYALIPEKAFQAFGKYINKKAISNSDLILTINQKLSELAVTLGADKDKVKLIDAGIDLENYDPDLDSTDIKNKYNISKDDVVLFFMGWIYDFAGIKELAREIGKNKDKYPNMKLLVVGDGDAYDELVNIKKQYDLGDNLILTGKQPYNLIPKFLSSADFCLLPAYIDEEIMQDIVPIKIYEYLAMKKVVIATKLPGIFKEFGQGHGIEYIKQASEVLALADNIIKNNEYDNIASAGRKYVEGNDWASIVNKFENTLLDLINSN